jgi:hypothetical protein
VGLIAAAAIGEIAVRASGMVDFPIYEVEDAIGYLPRPAQHGCLLRRRCWVFNDLSMGTGVAWNPAGHLNLTLIGNSIVMGGNPYDQSQKLGPLLQQRLGERYAVWPIAAGGWTNVNESVYLMQHPQIARHTDVFIWEFMSGGLSQLSPWRGEYVFPSTRPICALCYVLRRYALGPALKLDPGELPPQGGTSAANLAAFEAQLALMADGDGGQRQGILFLYPGKSELQQARAGREWLPERAQVEALSRRYSLQIIDVARDPRWSENLYREDWHPNVQGNVVLADILSDALKQRLPPATSR